MLKALRHHDNPFVWCGTSPAACEDCPSKCVPVEQVRFVWALGVNTDEGHYHNDPKVISVTETLNCPLKGVIGRMVDYAESPQALFARAHGTAIHHALEKANIYDEASEVGLVEAIRDGYLLQGTADRLTSEAVKDFKCMDSPRKTVDQQHIDQLSIYSDMAGGGRRLFICQVTRKGVFEVEVDYNPEALDTCRRRAGEMVDVLSGDKDISTLPPSGRFINHYRAKHCDYCPHEIRQRCEEIHPL